MKKERFGWFMRFSVKFALSVMIFSACIPSSGVLVKTFDDGMPMVRVPKGAFIMGSNSGEADERPEREVELNMFWIDRFEVTNSRYAECVKAGRCADNQKFKGFTDPNQPVVGVRWQDAADFCAWANKRLPTEAEWEKAARGEDGRPYPWGDTLECTRANYRECGRTNTTIVGSYPDGVSPYGAFDMAGNVAEWVSDWYDPNYYSRAPKENPPGPETGKYRVIRGGMWLRFAYQMRSATAPGKTQNRKTTSQASGASRMPDSLDTIQ